MRRFFEFLQVNVVATWAAGETWGGSERNVIVIDVFFILDGDDNCGIEHCLYSWWKIRSPLKRSHGFSATVNGYEH